MSKFFDISNLSFKDFQKLADMSADERNKFMSSRISSTWKNDDILRISQMSFKEELTAMLLFLYGNIYIF